jgi:hypothetical protein
VGLRLQSRGASGPGVSEVSVNVENWSGDVQRVFLQFANLKRMQLKDRIAAPHFCVDTVHDTFGFVRDTRKEVFEIVSTLESRIRNRIVPEVWALIKTELG